MPNDQNALDLIYNKSPYDKVMEQSRTMNTGMLGGLDFNPKTNPNYMKDVLNAILTVVPGVKFPTNTVLRNLKVLGKEETLAKTIPKTEDINRYMSSFGPEQWQKDMVSDLPHKQMQIQKYVEDISKLEVARNAVNKQTIPVDPSTHMYQIQINEKVKRSNIYEKEIDEILKILGKNSGK